MAVVLLLWMAVCAALAIEIGVNPYIGAAVGGGLLVLYETWTIARLERN